MSDGTSQSFDLPQVDRFTTGTVGPRGERTFFLQVTAGASVVSLKLEKAQVHALSEYLENMLHDLPTVESHELPVDWELADPIVPEWVVASMGVAYQQSENSIILWAEEALFDEDDDAFVAPATARFCISLAQAAGFVQRARSVVAAGRPPCRYCGGPLDTEGAWCACSN